MNPKDASMYYRLDKSDLEQAARRKAQGNPLCVPVRQDVALVGGRVAYNVLTWGSESAYRIVTLGKRKHITIGEPLERLEARLEMLLAVPLTRERAESVLNLLQAYLGEPT